MKVQSNCLYVQGFKKRASVMNKNLFNYIDQS